MILSQYNAMSYRCFLIAARRAIETAPTFNAIRAAMPQESAHYTEQFGIPIEIKALKQSKFDCDPKPDRLIVTIPNWFHPLDRLEEQRDGVMEMWKSFLVRIVKAYGHMYSQEKKLTLLNTPADLKARMKEWTTVIDVPMPKVSIRKAASYWGKFAPVLESFSGDVTLNEFLQFIPIDLAEETIVHELTHAKQWSMIRRNNNTEAARLQWNRTGHNSEFWQLLGSYMPDHKSRKDQMEKIYARFYSRDPLPSDT